MRCNFLINIERRESERRGMFHCDDILHTLTRGYATQYFCEGKNGEIRDFLSDFHNSDSRNVPPQPL